MVTISVNDALEAMHRGQHIDSNWFIDSKEERFKYNKYNTPDGMRFDVSDPDNIKVISKKTLVEEPLWDIQVLNGVRKWFIPEPYASMDIVEYVLALCSSEEEEKRVEEELILFSERELINVLRFLVYFVDVARINDITLGVGRGSSVASYVLFLIGVHKIDSLKYDLDIKEFLK